MDSTELSTAGEAQARIAELEQKVAALERSNQDLWRTNQRLGRERLGAQDSAAASIATKLDFAEAEIERMESSLSWRLTEPVRWPGKLARWIFRRIKPRLRSIAVRLFR